jgi:hypothetical protein
VGGGGHPFQGGLHVGGQAAQRLQLGLVGRQFGLVRQLAVHQQVGDFFKFARAGQVEDVVAAVVQVIASAAHGTQRGVAGRHARQGHGLLRLEGAGVRRAVIGFAHGVVSLDALGL